MAPPSRDSLGGAPNIAKMINTPPSARSSQDPTSPDAQHRITRKRNRVPLSCGPCRHRKLKCNRSQPCDNCVKRGDTQSCTYASAASRRRPGAGGGDVGTPEETQNRIDRLEGLVLSLMTNGSQAVGSEAARAALRSRPSLGGSSEHTTESGDMRDGPKDDDSEVEHVSRSIGVIKVHDDRQFYASEAHWWAILADIAEVKRYFSEHTKQYEEQVAKVTEEKAKHGQQAATSLLFKGTHKVDREKIVNSFPPRQAADSLIQRYLNTENPSIRILHGPSFRQEYERHWQNPSQTSIVWIGMVFAMMSMALSSYYRAADEPPEFAGTSLQLSETYAEITAQCLVAADFTQPVGYMIEALVFYALAEQMRRRDLGAGQEAGLWMLQGMIVRLAMRMGMHRDPDPYPQVNAFLGEMRRRCWSVIRSMDIMLSFQCGLPGMIQSTDTDTRLPTNIYDEEFGPESSKLPTSRPASEHTPVSFMISHTRITYVLGRIQELNVSLTMPAYEETMKMDAELREAYNLIPEHLRLQCRDGSSLDAANLVMQRFTLDLAYHKCQCVLHRKFLSRARKDPRFAYSRKVCLEACLQMLEHQSMLSREGQRGGRLSSITWAVSTSMTTHDFLLAAMIVCLDLYYTAQAEAEGQTSGEMYQWAVERREPMFGAIEAAMRVWESLKDSSMEAYKASSILRVMIEKLRNHQILRQQLAQNFNFSNDRHDGLAVDGSHAPEHSAAMTLGMMSTGMTPGNMSMYDQRYGGQQQQQPRTGLTPQPTPATTNSDSTNPQTGVMLTPISSQGGTTPFSNLFGPGFGGFEGMDIPATSLDWDGWDTYIHGPHRGDALATANLFDTTNAFAEGFDGQQNNAFGNAEGFSPAAVAAAAGKVEPSGGAQTQRRFGNWGGPGFVGGDPNFGS